MTDATGVEAATSVALDLASSLGLSASSASVLHSGANVSLLLTPARVVARVVAEVGRWRADSGFPDASRDVVVARATVAHGGPAIAPLAAPLGGPHRAGGRIVSFWEFVEVVTTDRGYDDPRGTGLALRRVHEALRAAGPTLSLPPLPVWDDVLSWIGLAPLLSEVDRAWLSGLHGRVSSQIDDLRLPWQPVHGDAHPGNALVTADGVRWTDFEETGAWPVEWDLACLMTGLPFGRDVEAIHAMLAAYGRSPDDPLLQPFLAARILVAASWMAVTGDYRGNPVGDRLARQLAWLEATQGR
jgi:thiamine kinase-like enzyme